MKKALLFTIGILLFATPALAGDIYGTASTQGGSFWTQTSAISTTTDAETGMTELVRLAVDDKVTQGAYNYQAEIAGGVTKEFSGVATFGPIKARTAIEQSHGDGVECNRQVVADEFWGHALDQKSMAHFGPGGITAGITNTDFDGTQEFRVAEREAVEGTISRLDYIMKASGRVDGFEAGYRNQAQPEAPAAEEDPFAPFRDMPCYPDNANDTLNPWFLVDTE